MIRRTRASIGSLAIAAAVFLPACSDTPNPTGVPRAFITLSVDPTPVIAVPSTRVGAAFSARFKLVIKETAGQGGEVKGVRATLYDEVTGALVGSLYYDTADMIVFVGEERVEAGGTLEVPIQIDYVIPQDVNAKAARLHANVDFEDDKGNAVNATILVKVE